jgi:type IV secretion system protein VirD4
MSGLSDRSQFNNRMLLAAVLSVIIGGPMYIALIGSVVSIYGIEYLLHLAVNPEVLLKYYQTLFEYWWAYKEQLGNAYAMKMVGPPGGALLISLTTLFAMRAPLMDFRPFKPKESIHGDAHWATKKEIEKAGLFAKQGVLMGQYKKGSYYIADGFQHLLLFAPTGSGKGVGFAIPNLLFWDQSVVVHDIKLENYELCSGWRAKQGQEVYVWNPADPNGITHCYNPMDWISPKPGQMVDDVMKIANLILPEQEFWQNEARAIFVGVVLYLLAVPEKPCSFGEVVRTMRSDDVSYNLAVVLDTLGKKLHPVGYMNIAAFLQKADKERSGVTSTLNSGLELWANPLIDTATATSDFNIGLWKKKRITVYCGVTPDNLQRLQPLLQVFYQQGTDILTRHMPKPDEPYGVLFLMDEFPTLGKMPQFEAGIAYFRGYRMRLFLIVQDTQQLKGIYEEAGMNSFLSNATYRITFAANNVETANLISQLIGNKTVRQESHNMPKFLDLNPAARTMHVSETQRALLLPQEVIQLNRDEQIILIESQPPIKCLKIKYFEDSFFTKRLLEKTFVPEQEPYDPRKKQEKAEKPEDKKDNKGKGPDAPAAAAASGTPPAPAPASGGEKKNPFDLPPLPGPKNEPAPTAAKANPFGAPPVPGGKPAAAAAASAEASSKDAPLPTPKPQASAVNPFELPPSKPGNIAKGALDDKGKPKAVNPFDLPLQPKPGSKADAPQTPEKFGPKLPPVKGDTTGTGGASSSGTGSKPAAPTAEARPATTAATAPTASAAPAPATPAPANPFAAAPRPPEPAPSQPAPVTPAPIRPAPITPAATSSAANPFAAPQQPEKPAAPSAQTEKVESTSTAAAASHAAPNPFVPPATAPQASAAAPATSELDAPAAQPAAPDSSKPTATSPANPFASAPVNPFGNAGNPSLQPPPRQPEPPSPFMPKTNGNGSGAATSTTPPANQPTNPFAAPASNPFGTLPAKPGADKPPTSDDAAQ